jgi:hypothetical protein
MMRLLALLGLLALAGPAAAAPTIPCSLTASSYTVDPGTATTLHWATTGATKVKINGARRAVRGSMSVAPLVKTVFTLTAKDRARRKCKQSVTIAMTGEAPTPPPPDGSLTGNIKHALWTGASVDDSDSELAQWMRDNVINVTPTAKRPTISTTMTGAAQTALASEIDAAGIVGMTGIGGPLVAYYASARYPEDNTWTLAGNFTLFGSDIKPFIDGMPGRKQKYLYVDEPTALCYGYTEASAEEKACTVRFWNAVRTYLRSVVSDGKFGLCMPEGYSHGRQLELLRAGLQADFVCSESYGTSAKYQDIFGAIHAEFPSVEKVALQDGTRSVCQLFDTYYTPGNVTAAPSYQLTIGYWDINDYMGYRGPGADKMWLANAQEHAQTGQRQFCKQPTATVYGVGTASGPNGYGADIELQTYNNLTVWHPQAGISWTSCEYRVLSYPANGDRSHMPSIQATAVETVSWTTIPCNGSNPAFSGATYTPDLTSGTPVKITVGSGANCRHNGHLACQLETRATNSLGKVGRAMIAFSINHSALSGYVP